MTASCCSINTSLKIYRIVLYVHLHWCPTAVNRSAQKLWTFDLSIKSHLRSPSTVSLCDTVYLTHETKFRYQMQHACPFPVTSALWWGVVNWSVHSSIPALSIQLCVRPKMLFVWSNLIPSDIMVEHKSILSSSTGITIRLQLTITWFVSNSSVFLLSWCPPGMTVAAVFILSSWLDLRLFRFYWVFLSCLEFLAFALRFGSANTCHADRQGL